MVLGGKKKVRSSNISKNENDDESVKSDFEDARETPVSKSPNLKLLSKYRCEHGVSIGVNKV